MTVGANAQAQGKGKCAMRNIIRDAECRHPAPITDTTGIVTYSFEKKSSKRGASNVPRLIVIYDPKDVVIGFPVDFRRAKDIQEATLSIPKDLEVNDISALARRLVELLLEQISKK